LIFASGAGAIANRTIGGSAMGGMLLGTLIGVLVIPGLYYAFAKMADGHGLIKNESHEPISEEMMRVSEEKNTTKNEISKLKKLLSKLTLKRNQDKK
jgi:HAE1 family hydrophobic/amphiphilic exporter-1